MEKTVKVFPASNWPYVQRMFIGIIYLEMLLLLKESGWNLVAIILLGLCARSCWSIYRYVQQQSLRATISRERLDANWPLLELSFAVISVLSLCIFFLRSSKHCM
jgi:hypothetical protein